jgi:hypothetical protein
MLHASPQLLRILQVPKVRIVRSYHMREWLGFPKENRIVTPRTKDPISLFAVINENHFRELDILAV